MWYLIFLFVLFLVFIIVSYPFLISIEVKFNVLRLKGVFTICLFNKIKLQYKVRVKHGYVYIYHKKKEKRIKLTDQTFDVIFFMNLIKQIYFRQQLLTLDISSNFGYLNDACVSAVGSGYIDVVVKSFLAKLKNNKKSAHIFINVEPKYNQDVCSMRVKTAMRISVWDVLYAVSYTLIYSWRKYDEKNRKSKFKQG